MRGSILGAALALATGAASAAEGPKLPAQDWSFDGIFGTYDRAELRRGVQVYNEVCAACHGLKFVSFRSLGEETGPGYDPDQVNALAALYEVADDAEVFSDHCRRLLQDPDLRRRLGTAARRHVTAHFDRRVIVDQLAERLRQALSC